MQNTLGIFLTDGVKRANRANRANVGDHVAMFLDMLSRLKNMTTDGEDFTDKL